MKTLFVFIFIIAASCSNLFSQCHKPVYEPVRRNSVFAGAGIHVLQGPRARSDNIYGAMIEAGYQRQLCSRFALNAILKHGQVTAGREWEVFSRNTCLQFGPSYDFLKNTRHDLSVGLEAILARYVRHNPGFYYFGRPVLPKPGYEYIRHNGFGLSLSLGYQYAISNTLSIGPHFMISRNTFTQEIHYGGIRTSLRF